MEEFKQKLAGIWRRITYNGINEETPFYEKKRMVVFNGLAAAGAVLSLLWLLYTITKAGAFQYSVLAAVNTLPLLLCIVIYLTVSFRYYKGAIAISLFLFPLLLLTLGVMNHEPGVRLMMFIYCIFPFFFLHHIQKIVFGFVHAAICFLVFEYIILTPAGVGFATLPAHSFYSLIFQALILLFLFAVLYSVKFQVWAYERSIQKRKEELTEKNDELKNLLLFRDKLTLILSHDAKVPLTGAVHLVEYLNLNNYKEEEVRKFLPLVSAEIRNTLEMFDAINKWASLKTNTSSGKFSKISSQCLFETVKGSITNVAAIKEITIRNNTNREHFAFADTNSMQVVLRNLLSNAVKFTPGGGTITVDSVVQDDYCLIKINDTGAGIDEAVIEKIFAGTIITTPGTNDEKGTGLGLQICMDLIKQNNGKITCQSEKGNGTTFIVQLPVPPTTHIVQQRVKNSNILSAKESYHETIFPG